MTQNKVIIVLLLIFVVASCTEQPIREANEIKKVLAYQPKPLVIQPKQNKAPSVQPQKPVASKKEVFYTVEKGDTLYSIGFRSGYGYWKLAEWNDISPPYTVHVGQQLRVSDTQRQVIAVPTPPVVEQSKPHVEPQKSHMEPPKLHTELPKPHVEQPKPHFAVIEKLERPMISKDKQKVLKLYWQWPIRGTILKNFARTSNKGIDIDCEYGQSIEAVADGEVAYSGNAIKAYGNLLIIKHDNIYLSAYANNSSLLVKEGQKIKQGQKIASCGKAAYGVAALHFEIRKNGKSVNPLVYLPR